MVPHLIAFFPSRIYSRWGEVKWGKSGLNSPTQRHPNQSQNWGRILATTAIYRGAGGWMGGMTSWTLMSLKKWKYVNVIPCTVSVAPVTMTNLPVLLKRCHNLDVICLSMVRSPSISSGGWFRNNLKVDSAAGHTVLQHHALFWSGGDDKFTAVADGCELWVVSCEV